MVVVKRLTFFAVAIIAIVLFVPPLLPDTMAIRGTILIDAPDNVVYAEINDFRNWTGWSAWNVIKEMPEPQYARGGYGPGSSVVWEDNEKDGYLQRFTIINSTPHSFNEIAFDFPGKAFCVSRINLTSLEAQTAVSWDIGVKTEGWKTLFFVLNNKKTLQKSLSALERSAIQWNRSGIQVVEQGTLESFPYVSIRRQVSRDALSEEMGKYYDLMIQNESEGAYQISGYPYAIYHDLGPEKADIECGFPIQEKSEHHGIIFSGVFKETACVLTEYTGSYEFLERGHEAVQTWMKQRGLIMNGPPVEIYITGEAEADNPDLWKTRICYPVKLPWE